MGARGLWVVLVLGAVCAFGCASTNPGGDPCAGMVCAGDQACDAGTCIKLPSCQTGTCPPGTACTAGVCSACTTNVRCSAGFSRCDPASGACATCASDGDCGGDFPHCGSGGCVQCTSSAQCPAGASHCKDGFCEECGQDSDCPAPATCTGGRCSASCIRDVDCPAVSPRCEYGKCIGCRDSNDCAAGQACYGSQCRPAYPGDSCLAALALDLSAGSVTVSGDMGSYPDETVQGTSYPPQDVFYSFTVTADSTLSATLDWDSIRTSMSMRLLAGDCHQLGQQAGGGSSLGPVTLAPGTYFLQVINIQMGLSGKFLLHLALTPTAAIPPGTSCLKPAQLALGVPGTTTVHQDLTGLPQPIGSTCQISASDPSFVYGFDVPEQAFYDFSLAPAATLQAGLALNRDYCWGGSETPYKPCVGLAPGNPTGFRYVLLEPGHHLVSVASEAHTAGAYDLTVSATPPMPNPTCQTALPLEFDGGVAVIAGDPGYALAGPSVCGASPGHNLYYGFSTVGLGARSLWVSGDPGAGSFGVSSSCTVDGGTRLDCGYGFDSSPVDLPNLPEGNYLLSASDRPFTLTARLGPAYPVPANDTCAAPQRVNLDAGTVTVSGDSRGANDDFYQCTRTNDGNLRRDVVYELSAPGRGLFSVTATPTDPAFLPVVQVTVAEGGSAASCASGLYHCVSAADAGTSYASWSGLGERGVAYVAVDSAGPGGGTFDLTSTFTAAPANDLCASAQTVTAGGSATGDLGIAFHDLQGCYWPTPIAGPDLFFKVTPSVTGTLTATLTPNGFDGRLAVMSGATPCTSSATCVGTVDAAGVGGVETLSFSATKNVAYLIAVGAPGSGGSFTLSVQ